MIPSNDILMPPHNCSHPNIGKIWYTDLSRANSFGGRGNRLLGSHGNNKNRSWGRDRVVVLISHYSFLGWGMDQWNSSAGAATTPPHAFHLSRFSFVFFAIEGLEIRVISEWWTKTLLGLNWNWFVVHVSSHYLQFPSTVKFIFTSSTLNKYHSRSSTLNYLAKWYRALC